MDSDHRILGTIQFSSSSSTSLTVSDYEAVLDCLKQVAFDQEQTQLIAAVSKCIRQRTLQASLSLTNADLSSITLSVASTSNTLKLPLVLCEALFPRKLNNAENTMELRFDQAARLLARCCPKKDSYPRVDLATLQPATVAPTLLPYQKRALSWMLMREGKLEGSHPQGPLFAETVILSDGTTCYLNRCTGVLSFLSGESSSEAFVNDTEILGGILADEMGLGKTVEILSLICAHPARKKHTAFQCTQCTSASALLSTGATLIITPSSILSQWISEIQRHTPTLSFKWYKGRLQHDSTTAIELSSKDIVITSYDVLQKEVHLARGDNSRSRRAERAYERPTSPLVEINWWRVCLDEAQMVESTASQTSEMAHLIPRIHPWAVTGTPVSKSGMLEDLKGLCVFLGLEPFANGHQNAFKWIVEDRNFEYLVQLFARVLHRNTKVNVKDELELPKQNQFIVELGFSAIERSYYDELFETCLEEIRKNDLLIQSCKDIKRRNRLIEEGKVKMRQWLLQLRQVCCHPQVGEQNKNTLGGKIGTIGEVLEVMKRQSVSATITTERNLINMQISKAHLHEFLKEYERGISVYEATLRDIRARIQRTSQELDELKLKMKRHDNNEDNDGDDDDDKKYDESGADSNVELRTMLSNQLSAYKELEHQAVFFIACCYNSLQNEPLETKYYADAEQIRREILLDFEMVVEKRRAHLFNNPDTFKPVLAAIKKMSDWRKSNNADDMKPVGIVVRNDMERTKDLLINLNSQWDQVVVEWRGRILKLINTNLENVEEAHDSIAVEGRGNGTHKPSGEEYNRGEEVQVELDTLMDHYAELLSERQELLNGMLFTKSSKPEELPTQLNRSFNMLRKKFALQRGSTNLSAVLKDLKYSIDDDKNTPDIEREIASAFLVNVQRGVELHIKCVDELQKELAKLRKLANARIEFFKHLQQISNSVDPPKKPDDIESELENVNIEINKTEGLAKYLENLSPQSNTAAAEKDQSSNIHETEDYECLVCKSPFDEGYVTECGHFYCDYCMQQWIPKHRKCAMCKNPIHDIQTQMAKVENTKQKADDDTHLQKQDTSCVYLQQTMEVATQARISSLKLDSRDSFGTKTDFILRHLLHIITTEPTAKCLLFSQWDQVLNIVAMGCVKNGIGFVKMSDAGRGKKKTDPVQKFLQDPDMKLFMLNAKSQSSGLTLVDATHVFLVEPVVNPGLEMQAINRVHRIGQTKETFVYRYIIKETIEGRVYSIFNRNMRKNAELETKKEGKGLGGGEKVVDQDVEWCLVGDTRKSISHAIPCEEDEMTDNMDTADIEEEGEEVVMVEADLIYEQDGEDNAAPEEEREPIQRSQFGTGRRGHKRR
ncbi:SNF2 family N-terminal domain-containing protein, partial [Obelidium mucronatum]